MDSKSPEFGNYIKSLNKFNELLLEEIRVIEGNANKLLKDTFKENIKLTFSYHNASFNQKELGTLFPPTITIKANMTNPRVADPSDIEHPKSFFNEAKITCMALAIRLAILNLRTPVESACSLLCFDDLLISLDKSLRQTVLPIMLAYADSRQIIMLTHDRSVYNLAIKTIKKHEEDTNPATGEYSGFGKWDSDWATYELFVDNFSDIPKSVKIENRTYLDKAKIHFCNFRIGECANALRKCCEEQMKRLLPKSDQVIEDEKNGTFSEKKLAQLITAFENRRKLHRMPDIAPTLDSERDLILNPFSHDDTETPYYMREMKMAIDSMVAISAIRKNQIISNETVGNDDHSFTLTKTNGEYTASATFVFKERFENWIYKEEDYLGSPLVKVNEVVCSESAKLNKDKGKNINLKSLYYDVCNAVSLRVTENPMTLSDIIDDTTRKSL